MPAQCFAPNGYELGWGNVLALMKRVDLLLRPKKYRELIQMPEFVGTHTFK